MSEQAEIEAKLMELLEPFNRAGVALTPETRISSDLNIDSADVLDFVMEVEDAYDLDIPMNDLTDVHTVRELAALVRQRLKARDRT